MHTVRPATTRAAAAVIGLSLASLTACSGGADVAAAPQEALAGAVQELGDHEGLELTFGIDGDPDAFASAVDPRLDDATVRLLLDSSVTVRGDDGDASGDGGDREDARAEVLFDLAGERAVELRLLPAQRLFARVDLDAVDRALADPAAGRGLDDLVAGAERFGLGELAATVRSGGWVEVRGLEQLAALAGTGDGTEAADDPARAPDARDRLVAALEAFLTDDVDLTYVGEEQIGEDQVGDHLAASTTPAELGRFLEEVSSIASELGGVDTRRFGLDPLGLGTAPDGATDGTSPVTVDLWIADGELRRIGIDLATFAGGAVDATGSSLLVDIDEFEGTVTAPEGATQVDLLAILGGLLGGALGDAGPAAP